MAEHKPILKNNQNTYHTSFGFKPKTGKAFLNTGVFTVKFFYKFINLMIKTNNQSGQINIYLKLIHVCFAVLCIASMSFRSANNKYKES